MSLTEGFAGWLAVGEETVGSEVLPKMSASKSCVFLSAAGPGPPLEVDPLAAGSESNSRRDAFNH